jgi:membrane protein
MSPRGAFDLLKAAFNDWMADEAPRLGAALAYYTLFALAPLLVVAISIAGLVFGREAAQGRIVAELQGVVGQNGAEAVNQLIQNSRKPATGIVASVLGLLTLLLGAAGAFVELRSALNRIWDVKTTSTGIWGFVRDRLAAFALVLSVGFLLMASLVLSAALTAAGGLLSRYISHPVALLHAANAAVSFLVITALFALIFKLLPDAKIAWSDVWVGAALTSLLFTVGKFAIGLYLGQSGVTSTYGAAGSVVVLIVWVYYFAQIFYFGAELTQAYARAHGSRRGEPARSERPNVQRRAKAAAPPARPAARASTSEAR